MEELETSLRIACGKGEVSFTRKSPLLALYEGEMKRKTVKLTVREKKVILHGWF
jgi:hypothetical protein